MDYVFFISIFTCLIMIGCIAGFLAGLLGIGGGIVLVPAFFYLFQVLGFNGPDVMQTCLATSLATIIVTSTRSLQSHNKKGAVDWDVLLGWGPWIAVGAMVSVAVAAGLSSITLQVIFGALGAIIGTYLVVGNAAWRLGTCLPVGYIRTIFASVIGFLSVLLGIGGASFGVPLMTLYGISIHRAVATAAGFGLAISVPSCIGWLFVHPEAPHLPFSLGAINLPAVFIIAPLTFVMAPLGARVAHATDANHLRRIFGVFLLIVAISMVRTVAWG